MNKLQKGLILFAFIFVIGYGSSLNQPEPHPVFPPNENVEIKVNEPWITYIPDEPQPSENLTALPLPSESRLLYVNGNEVMKQGNRFIIKAIAASHNDRHREIGSRSTSSTPDQSWFTEEAVKHSKQIGANTVDFHGIWLAKCINGEGEIQYGYYTDWIDIWVKWCTDNEIYVILDFQSLHLYPSHMPDWVARDFPEGIKETVEGRAEVLFEFYDDTVEHMDDERELWYKVFEYTANRYKKNPFVMYALSNEPMHSGITINFATNVQRIQLGESYSRISAEAVSRIRSTGSKQIVFIDKPYIYDSTREEDEYIQAPDTRDNVVWEVHYYMKEDRQFDDWKAHIELWLDETEEWGIPMYVGEWGIVKPEDNLAKMDWQTEFNKQFTYMKNINGCFYNYGFINGWKQWTYQLPADYVKFVEENLYS